MTSPRICVCFFGLNRSLSLTYDSIRENILGPLQRTGLEHHVYAAFMQVEGAFSNPHSGEHGVRSETDSHLRLNARRIELIDQAAFDRDFDLERFRPYGDAWNDNYVNTRNLCRALKSLERVTELWRDDGWSANDLFLYLRPDMIYHDPFDLPCYLGWLRRSGERLLATPRWALYSGLNDRFAIMGRAAAQAFGYRSREIDACLAATRQPLHAELFLKYIADTHRLLYRPYFLKLRATRVRANGTQVDESFDPQHHLAARALVRFQKLFRR